VVDVQISSRPVTWASGCSRFRSEPDQRVNRSRVSQPYHLDLFCRRRSTVWTPETAGVHVQGHMETIQQVSSASEPVSQMVGTVLRPSPSREFMRLLSCRRKLRLSPLYSAGRGRARWKGIPSDRGSSQKLTACARCRTSAPRTPVAGTAQLPPRANRRSRLIRSPDRIRITPRREGPMRASRPKRVSGRRHQMETF
jgi:hypothetical protein